MCCKIARILVVTTLLVILPQTMALPNKEELYAKYQLHLKCCCNEYPGVMIPTRNSTGHILSMKGIVVEMLDWLSHRLNIKFECIPLIGGVTTIENATKSIGNVFRVKVGLCDLSPSAAVITYPGFKEIDFLHPWSIDPIVLLIPEPVLKPSVSTIWKPLQPEVWTFVVTYIVVTFVLISLHYIYYHSTISKSGFVPKKSIYIEDFNRGMLKMLEMGLVYKWQDTFQPKLNQCLHPLTGKEREMGEIRNPQKIKLLNLAGVFAVLLVGYALATAAFLIEHIASAAIAVICV